MWRSYETSTDRIGSTIACFFNDRCSVCQTECETTCALLLEARLVSLVAAGSHLESKADITSTRLYQNLTGAVLLMAFYDVNNAKLSKIFEGEGLTHGQPLLDEDDFERFVQTVEPLMKAGRDVLWVLAGRTDSNLPQIKTASKTHKLTFEAFLLCYNTKQMEQYCHWKRQRGIANSKSLEQALYVYTDRMPNNMPKKREYVDGGNPLLNEVVKNVPVLSPKHQALVSRKIRETSLTTMVGVDHTEDDEEKETIKRSACRESDEGADAQGLHQPEPDQP